MPIVIELGENEQGASEQGVADKFGLTRVECDD